jgi:hypothetical protein
MADREGSLLNRFSFMGGPRFRARLFSAVKIFVVAVGRHSLPQLRLRFSRVE